MSRLGQLLWEYRLTVTWLVMVVTGAVVVQVVKV